MRRVILGRSFFLPRFLENFFLDDYAGVEQTPDASDEHGFEFGIPFL